jgi:hypothetical protein
MTQAISPLRQRMIEDMRMPYCPISPSSTYAATWW